MSSLVVLYVCISVTAALDMVGWYATGDGLDPVMPPEAFPWDYYSHMVFGHPIVSEDGVASCDFKDENLTRVRTLAQKYGRKLIWRPGLPNALWPIMSNASFARYKANYLKTIGQAVRDCQIDGIEFDYECPYTPLGKMGIVSREEATTFTQFLADVKASMGGGRQISCDMGVWGVTWGSYPFMLQPWVNVSMVINGAIDYINTMSYHYPALSGDIFGWQKDGYILSHLWGIPKSMINIGIPYFYRDVDHKEEVAWTDLSPKCPNLDPGANMCNGVRILSKLENREIGRWVMKEGYRGVFPWAASFDSLTNNNTLSSWVFEGLQGR